MGQIAYNIQVDEGNINAVDGPHLYINNIKMGKTAGYFAAVVPPAGGGFAEENNRSGSRNEKADSVINEQPEVICENDREDIQGTVADRIIFQSDETELKDKTVLREQQKRGDDANMDSADSVSVILSAEGKNKELGVFVYIVYISNKDDAFPAYFVIRNVICN